MILFLSYLKHYHLHINLNNDNFVVCNDKLCLKLIKQQLLDNSNIKLSPILHLPLVLVNISGVGNS